MNPRLNRLKRDYEKLQELAAQSQFVHISKTRGDPPDKYRLKLTCKGISKLIANKPVVAELFYLDVTLTDEYPRKGPILKIRAEKTPIFHPNIAQSGWVCYGDTGDHGWSPAMRLDDVIVRVIQMIRYENVGFESAFNLVAAEWARKNLALFPLDQRDIRGEALDISILDDRDPLDEIRIL
jgi:ubiquitin-protein ligase